MLSCCRTVDIHLSNVKMNQQKLHSRTPAGHWTVILKFSCVVMWDCKSFPLTGIFVCEMTNCKCHCVLYKSAISEKQMPFSLFSHDQGMVVTKVPFIAFHFIARGWNKTVPAQCCSFSSISDISSGQIVCHLSSKVFCCFCCF